MKLKWFLLLILFAFFANTQAQDYVLQKITDKSGRTLGIVNDVTQDNDGFLWIATKNGLFRYDGYDFKHYRRTKTDTALLPFNNVHQLFFSQHTNVLWTSHNGRFAGIKNEKKYTAFGKLSEREFQLYSKINEDVQGNMWIMSYGEGIFRYNTQKNDFDFSSDKEQTDLLSLNTGDLIADKNKNIVIVNEYQIAIFDSSANNFVTLYKSKGGIFEGKAQPSCMVADHENNYWIGTQNGVYKFDYALRQLTKVISISGVVLSLTNDNNGNIWFTSQGGLNRFHLITGKLYTYTVLNSNLWSNQVGKIFTDKAGNIWITTKEGLNKIVSLKFNYTPLMTENFSKQNYYFDDADRVFFQNANAQLVMYNPTNRDFQMFSVARHKLFSKLLNRTVSIDKIFASQNDRILFISNNKLLEYDLKNQKPERSTELENVLIKKQKTDNKINFIQHIENNRYMVFALGGIYEFNSGTWKVQKKVSFDTIADAQTGKFYKFVFKDSDNNFYIRAENGIYYYNHKTFKQLLAFEPDVIGTSVTEGNIVQDTKKNIWVVVFPHLYKFPAEATRYIEYDLDFTENVDIAPCNLFVDLDDWLWIYTDNGLFSFNQISKEIRTYTTKEGLASNSINDLTDDGHGNIWISTLNGLSSLDKSTDNITSFFTGNESNSHKFIGIYKHVHNNTSEINFLTSGGYLTFYPENTNKNKPTILLTRVLLYGEEMKFDSLVYQKKYFKLKHNQNYLTFEFAALDFTNPERNQYAYMLSDIDPKWTIVPSTDRRAVFTNLPPGDYILKIKASNNDEEWNEHGIEVHIEILPPWWKTLWAYIAYVILGAALVYLIVYIRVMSLKKDKKNLEQKVEERTQEIMKQNVEITLQRDKIAGQKKEITDSIEYASRIQNAILTPVENIRQIIKHYFILNKPKEIVSGDFYWMKKATIQNQELALIICADCTGHGVPGAFMSMLGVTLLDEIVDEFIERNQLPQMGEILDKLRQRVIKSLHQTNANGQTKDGMDIAACMIDTKTNQLQFAGAYNPAYILRAKELNKLPVEELPKNIRAHDSDNYLIFEILPDRMPIGIYFKQMPFTTNYFYLQADDKVFMFSDGYMDQFSPEGKKFMAKPFRKLLTDNAAMAVEDFNELLLNAHINWKRDSSQIDDILVVGFKI